MTQPTQECAILWCERERLDNQIVCKEHGVGIWMQMQDAINDVVDNPQGDRLVTYKQIRIALPGLKSTTVRAWIARGNLKPVTTTPSGLELYSIDSILAMVNLNEKRTTKHERVVYYLRMVNGNIKIGTSTNVQGRLTVWRYTAEDLLATESGGFDLESERHKQFAAERVGKSEAFRPSKRLMEHIESLATHCVSA